MIKTFLKHLIYEKCIDLLFENIYKNFVLNKLYPTIWITNDFTATTVSDGKNTLIRKYDSPISSYPDEMTLATVDFLIKYHPKIVKDLDGLGTLKLNEMHTVDDRMVIH